MDESATEVEYPRERSAGPQIYYKDGIWSILSLVTGGLGLLQHTAHALGYGLGQGGRQAGAAMLVAIYLLRLIGGLGLLTSRRWGFVALLLSSLAYVGLFAPKARPLDNPIGAVWLLFALWLVVYSALRLLGLEGPKPLRIGERVA